MWLLFSRETRDLLWSGDNSNGSLRKRKANTEVHVAHKWKKSFKLKKSTQLPLRICQWWCFDSRGVSDTSLASSDPQTLHTYSFCAEQRVMGVTKYGTSEDNSESVCKHVYHLGHRITTSVLVSVHPAQEGVLCKRRWRLSDHLSSSSECRVWLRRAIPELVRVTRSPSNLTKKVHILTFHTKRKNKKQL